MLQKLPILDIRPGKALATVGDRPQQNSTPGSPRIRRMMKLAARMFNLLPPLDVIDPESFIAETISIFSFSGYPETMIERVVREIPRRTDRPTLKLIKAVCDEFYAPIEREEERRSADESHRLAITERRTPRTPEQQARIDAQVARARQQFADAALRNISNDRDAPTTGNHGA